MSETFLQNLHVLEFLNKAFSSVVSFLKIYFSCHFPDILGNIRETYCNPLNEHHFFIRSWHITPIRRPVIVLVLLLLLLVVVVEILYKHWHSKPKPSVFPSGPTCPLHPPRLCFLHAACALAQLSSKRVYELWVLPPLRLSAAEGVSLAKGRLIEISFGRRASRPVSLKFLTFQLESFFSRFCSIVYTRSFLLHSYALPFKTMDSIPQDKLPGLHSKPPYTALRHPSNQYIICKQCRYTFTTRCT